MRYTQISNNSKEISSTLLSLNYLVQGAESDIKEVQDMIQSTLNIRTTITNATRHGKVEPDKLCTLFVTVSNSGHRKEILAKAPLLRNERLKKLDYPTLEDQDRPSE